MFSLPNLLQRQRLQQYCCVVDGKLSDWSFEQYISKFQLNTTQLATL